MALIEGVSVITTLKGKIVIFAVFNSPIQVAVLTLPIIALSGGKPKQPLLVGLDDPQVPSVH